MKINTVLIPAAGLGTRFLPYTMCVPKEMLPLGNKPAIHYIAEEVVASGSKNMCLIINKDKQLLADYFKPHQELETLLQSRGKSAALSPIIELRSQLSVSTCNQAEPLGMGHALLMAEDKVSPDEFVGIILPDDIVDSEEPALKQLMLAAQRMNASVIAVQEVPPHAISAYGVVNIKEVIDNDLVEISGVIEKPAADKAPSNLAIIGRYVFCPKLFPALHSIEKSPSGEYQLTDAMDYMIDHMGERVFAYKLKGKRYDTGTPAGWVEAVNGFAHKK